MGFAYADMQRQEHPFRRVPPTFYYEGFLERVMGSLVIKKNRHVPDACAPKLKGRNLSC